MGTWSLTLKMEEIEAQPFMNYTRHSGNKEDFWLLKTKEG